MVSLADLAVERAGGMTERQVIDTLDSDESMTQQEIESELGREDLSREIQNVRESPYPVVTRVKGENVSYPSVEIDTGNGEMKFFDIEKSDNTAELLQEIREIREQYETEYSMAFDMSYLEKPELSTTQDQINYLTAEVLGVHDELRNAELEEKESLRILGIGEPALGTKLYSSEAWTGLAYKLEELREEHGEDYFSDDNFRAVTTGSVIPRLPTFYSITNNEDFKMLKKLSSKGDGDEFEREVNDVVDMIEDEETIEAVLEERFAEVNGGKESHVKELKQALSEEMDVEEVAQKIVSYEEAIESVEQEFGKISEAIGRDVPLMIADGEEGRKNRKDLKEIKIQNYSEEVKETAEKLGEDLEQMYDKLNTLRDALQQVHDEVDDEDYSGTIEQLEEMEVQDLLSQSFSDMDIDENLETYQDIQQLEEEINSGIQRLETSISSKKMDLGAELAEESVKNALGPSGAKILNRTNIEADANEILEKMTEKEYEKLHENIDNIDLKARVNDKGLLSFELNGWTVEAAHNLNSRSDTTLKSGQEEMIRERQLVSDEEPDLYLSGHHGPTMVQNYKEDRGPLTDFVTALQLSTFQDREKVRDAKKDGIRNNWHVKRLDKGLFDSSVVLAELEVKEGPEGNLHKVPSFKVWDGEYLENIGKQIKVENFVEKHEEEKIEAFARELRPETPPEKAVEKFRERFSEERDEEFIEAFRDVYVEGNDYKQQNTMEMEVRGDDQIGAPHNMRFGHQTPAEEMIPFQFAWQEKHASPDRKIIDVGDSIQGTDIYYHQESESSAAKGFEQDELVEGVEENMREYIGKKLVEAGEDDSPLDSVVPNRVVEAVKYASKRNTLQEPEMDLSKQFRKMWKLLDQPYSELVEDGAELYLVSGNHVNDNMKGKNMDESIMRETNFPGKTGEDVHIVRGASSTGRAIKQIGNNDALLTHKNTGTGKSKPQKILKDPLAGEVDLMFTGHSHQATFVKKNGFRGFAPATQQPSNDLVDQVISGDPVRGILSTVRVDEDPEIGETEVEFLLE
ncbi:MAG: hypothetical protein ABEJ98_04290 [Candidatus Nanohaloarchaea archaeon]